MTVSQKSALSLLISVFFFAGFTVLAFTGLFNLVETRFYNPSVAKSLGQEVDQDAKTIEKFFDELRTSFSATLDQAAVRRSFLPNQSAEDIFERTRTYGMLLESRAGLQSIRFIDSGGVRIHFSTWPRDILRQDRLSVAYRDYNDNPDNLPYDQVEARGEWIAASSQGNTKFTLDEASERIIFSMPFYDSFDVYRGTALFTLSVRAVTEQLVSEGRIKVGEDVSLVSNPSGILSGLPGTSRNELLSMVSSIWSEGILSLSSLDSAGSGTALALVSAKTSQGIFVGRLVNEGLFVFPTVMKIILLCSFFLTVYLIVFLFFNLRQDTMTVVQNRLKSLQLSLIEQYYDNKSDMDWNRWVRELEQRREDIRVELKRGVKTKQDKGSGRDIDALIDKSWNELLTVIGSRQNTGVSVDEDKLQAILNRILQAAPAGTPAPSGTSVGGTSTPGLSAAASPQPESAAIPAAEAEELEELEEIEEVITVEEVEKINVVEEIEELEELEELAADAGEADDDTIPEPELCPPDNSSNVRLAFGDDDIPYIVESNGLELVEENIEAMNTMKSGDESEDYGVLEELTGDAEDGEAVEVRAPGTKKGDLADLASKIEFGAGPKEGDGNDPIGPDLEVVSPFGGISFDSDEDEQSLAAVEAELVEELPAADDPFAEELTTDAGEDEEKKGVPGQISSGGLNKTPEPETFLQNSEGSPLEELFGDNGISILYRPFLFAANQCPETLKALDDEPAAPDTGDIILEYEGIHFINSNILEPGTEKNLNSEFKELVDSVLIKR